MSLRVNVVCRDTSRVLAPDRPEPSFVDSTCSFCGSMDALILESLLKSGSDARWVEPTPGKMVSWVELSNGKRFNLNHLFDEPLTSTDYDRIQQLLEDTCGNLLVFMRKITKYQNE